MPAHKIIPPDQELKKMVDAGMTHQQIADELFTRTGHRVARSTVSAALHRSGLTSRDGHRYKDIIPWRVNTRHLAEYPVRILRLLGRRMSGLPLGLEEEARLDSWLANLERENLVVAYCPNHTPGFLYVEADERTDRPDGIPIRPRSVAIEEIVE